VFAFVAFVVRFHASLIRVSGFHGSHRSTDSENETEEKEKGYQRGECETEPGERQSRNREKRESSSVEKKCKPQEAEEGRKEGGERRVDRKKKSYLRRGRLVYHEMDVITSVGAAGVQGIEKVVVHPLVLLSIVDNYNRVAKDTQKRVLGVLLGSTFRGRVDITNSYAGKRSLHCSLSLCFLTLVVFHHFFVLSQACFVEYLEVFVFRVCLLMGGVIFKHFEKLFFSLSFY
jgi:hypothetical protein